MAGCAFHAQNSTPLYFMFHTIHKSMKNYLLLIYGHGAETLLPGTMTVTFFPGAQELLTKLQDLSEPGGRVMTQDRHCCLTSPIYTCISSGPISAVPLFLSSREEGDTPTSSILFFS